MLNGSDGNSGQPAGLSSIHCPNITKLLNAYLSSLSSNENITLSIGDVAPIKAQMAQKNISEKCSDIHRSGSVFLLALASHDDQIRTKKLKEQEFKMYRRYMKRYIDNCSSTQPAEADWPISLALQKALNMVNAIPSD
ncbi:hypothetical protein AVEN_67521-1 [Araneus ventricosus]|uniref:Uncharacterized protein n=1 Tax=Araneus ventricosus TaxID=182803 RepID=A0A4Y2G809_ARAVE|nr:hypothetical protein AVEN_67521-1 [Araneus ventricosus]